MARPFRFGELTTRALVMILISAAAVVAAGRWLGWWQASASSSTATAVSLEDPVTGFSFSLQVGDQNMGYFTECYGIGSQSEVVEHKITIPNDGVYIQLLPGQLIWTDVILRRGLTNDVRIWDWRQLIIEGKINEAQADCTITAYNQAGEEIAHWELPECWPSAVTGPLLAQDSADMLVEQVVIVHEGTGISGTIPSPPLPPPPPPPTPAPSASSSECPGGECQIFLPLVVRQFDNP